MYIFFIGIQLQVWGFFFSETHSFWCFFFFFSLITAIQRNIYDLESIRSVYREKKKGKIYITALFHPRNTNPYREKERERETHRYR